MPNRSLHQQFLKVLGKKDVLALAFGAMIGWGWVVSSGTWITEAGSIGAVLAFAIGGVLVLLIGLTYAELSSALPLAGGEFVFSYQAMGRLPSFITTWAVIFGYVSVIAFEAVALPTVFEYIIPCSNKGSILAKLPDIVLPVNSNKPEIRSKTINKNVTTVVNLIPR